MSPGVKHDAGKLRWSLFPWDAAGWVVRVLMKGAEKYAPENWRKVPNWEERYFDAAIRHLEAWRRGEEADPEWGLPHLAHAGCCVLFLLALDRARPHKLSPADSTAGVPPAEEHRT